jgi:hypothetical protein
MLVRKGEYAKERGQKKDNARLEDIVCLCQRKFGGWFCVAEHVVCFDGL